MRHGPFLLTCLLFATACAVPQRLPHHRSALLSPDLDPLVPEGRAQPIPDAEATADEAGGEGVPARAASLNIDRSSVVRTAASRLGKKSVNGAGQRYPEDCSGLMRAVFASHGVDLFADGVKSGENGVSAIYRFAARRGGIHRGAPRPGEFVFFHNTYDRNRDGRMNDGLTHIGLVEGVDADGCVRVIHHTSHGVVREKMNLGRPNRHQDDSGKVINDWLRSGKDARVMGELFEGFGGVWR